MMTRFAALLAAGCLGACGTTAPTSVSGPSGAPIIRAKCSASPNVCFSQAAQACGGGTYQVLSSESHAGGLVADVLPGPVTWYSMTFQCGASDGRMPDFPFGGPSTGEWAANLPQTVAVRPRPTTTNCTSMGNSVNCTSY